jgi:ferrous iron transport protein A
LKKGEQAVISEILGDDSLTMRLYEMGLLEEEPIKLIGAAPLGDPLEFSIRGYRLSLRKSEAARVQVKPKAD